LVAAIGQQSNSLLRAKCVILAKDVMEFVASGSECVSECVREEYTERSNTESGIDRQVTTCSSTSCHSPLRCIISDPMSAAFYLRQPVPLCIGRTLGSPAVLTASLQDVESRVCPYAWQVAARDRFKVPRLLWPS